MDLIDHSNALVIIFSSHVWDLNLMSIKISVRDMSIECGATRHGQSAGHLLQRSRSHILHLQAAQVGQLDQSQLSSAASFVLSHACAFLRVTIHQNNTNSFDFISLFCPIRNWLQNPYKGISKNGRSRANTSIHSTSFLSIFITSGRHIVVFEAYLFLSSNE